MSEVTQFTDLGLSPEMLSAISAKGFETPSPIQRLTIPVLLGTGNDVIAQAQTGTGKTAAFGLPVLEKLRTSKDGAQALILVPTRELALQVTEELLSFNCHRLSIAPIYGGAAMNEQLRRLQKGIDVVVGTPGRILDHIRRGTLRLDHLRYLILDEADEMLNMGFIEDVEEIMSHADQDRRVLLFSATMPKRIVDLSKRYMHDVEILKVESQQMTADLTNQIYFEVRESDKFDALTRIIDVEQDFYGIVFSRTKVGVDEMVNRLLERGYAAEGLHGDVSQAQREKILRKFKKKQANILVATDVAARGIDVNNLSHVINYSLPQDSESYVHRIGRTGRAGNEGTAITFISSSELRQFGFLKRDIKVEITRATLPTPQDVIATKRARIKEELNEVIESENYTEYMEMAAELLSGHPAPVAMSALLRLAFKNDLAESNYPEIRSINVDRRGKARLFISIGRMDGYDARKMVDLMKRECGLNDSKIDDVKVMDSYTFVSVPFADAEQVVRKLNALRKGNRPLAEIAKDEAGGGQGSRPERRERPDRGERAERSERPARRERPERAEREDRGERPERSERRASYEKPAAEPRNDFFADKKKYSAEPAFEDFPDFKREKSAPKDKPKLKTKAATPKEIASPQRQKAAPGEDMNVSAGGFDWSAFEAALPGNWDRPGKKKPAAESKAKPAAKAKPMAAKMRSKR